MSRFTWEVAAGAWRLFDFFDGERRVRASVYSGAKWYTFDVEGKPTGSGVARNIDEAKLAAERSLTNGEAGSGLDDAEKWQRAKAFIEQQIEAHQQAIDTGGFGFDALYTRRVEIDIYQEILDRAEGGGRMSDYIHCPNCDSRMGRNESCPECDHWDDYPDCECQYCLDEYGDEEEL